MGGTNPKLTKAVETYLDDLRRVHASGGATGERSSYGPLANLLNAVGATLKPKVFCVGELADQGAGHPDFGLYTAKQVQRGRPREGQAPERGVVEVKSPHEDLRARAVREQVTRYWGRYRLVLVTNLREFGLVGPDPDGGETMQESFRLAESEEEFARRLEHPRAFARAVGAGLGEYLSRALSHRAALAEPKDLAWLLASYARDGLARVEAAGDAPSLKAVRSALEFEGNPWIGSSKREIQAGFTHGTLVHDLANWKYGFWGVHLFPAWLLGDGLCSDGDGARRANLSVTAERYLDCLGMGVEDLFHHVLAVLHSPAYREDNAGAFRMGWPRIPLPGWPSATAEGAAQAIAESAARGRELARLLDSGTPVPGITQGTLRPEIAAIAVPATVDGRNMTGDDFALTAGWGHFGSGDAVMPGQGRVVERAHTSDERAALDDASTILGKTTFDVHLNRRAWWRNVPAAVWRYKLGGYQVLKKWLSYREHEILARPLQPEEVQHFSDTARRIAAILMTVSSIPD